MMKTRRRRQIERLMHAAERYAEKCVALSWVGSKENPDIERTKAEEQVTLTRNRLRNLVKEFLPEREGV